MLKSKPQETREVAVLLTNPKPQEATSQRFQRGGFLGLSGKARLG